MSKRYMLTVTELDGTVVGQCGIITDQMDEWEPEDLDYDDVIWLEPGDHAPRGLMANSVYSTLAMMLPEEEA